MLSYISAVIIDRFRWMLMLGGNEIFECYLNCLVNILFWLQVTTLLVTILIWKTKGFIHKKTSICLFGYTVEFLRLVKITTENHIYKLQATK